MPSPFPGMNPYLEQPEVWHDFHGSFIPETRNVLSAQLSPNYIVKIDEHIYIHDPVDSANHMPGRGDVTLTETGMRAKTSATALAEPPVRVWVPIPDVEGSSFLEVRDRASRELVTVIELLSPSNKTPGKDREQYLLKREQILASNVHLVEIDLLRIGERMPMTALPQCDYCVLVSRSIDRPASGAWTTTLKERLPEIAVPVRTGDAPARLDLQQILHRVYDSSSYEHYIYEGSPSPPLSQEWQNWARQYLPE